MRFFDSHAHITVDSDPHGTQLDALLNRALEAHVCAVTNVCVDAASLARGIQAASRVSNIKIYNVAASTPHDVQNDGEYFFPIVEKAVQDKHLVAIGETGLDYHYFHSHKESQHLYLRKYLRLADKARLPIVIHCRDAFSDFFRILDEETSHFHQPLSGVLHCFTGTMEDAKNALDRGWYLSFSGIITFKNSQKLQEVVQFIPIEKLLIETDTPYLAPAIYRGKKNEPAYLVETARCISAMRGMDLGDFSEKTYENASQFFQV